MEEQKSIFADPASTFSSRNFYTIAQWSKFIGIMMLIGGGAFIILGFLLRDWVEDILGLTQFTTLYPFVSILHDMSPTIWILILVLVSSVISLIGILFLRIAKSSRDYYHTQSSESFIQMMQAVRWLFLLSAISTVLTALPSFSGALRIF